MSKTAVRLLRLSLAVRAGSILLLLLASWVQQSFDTSSELLALQLGWFPTAFVRWDTIYFISIAREGYRYEQTLAFQPGVPMLMRVVGYISPDLRWNISSAVVISTLLANLASVVSPLFLHRLTARHFAPDFAWTTAVLSLLAPTGGTNLSSPTPEAFFSIFSLLGMCALSTPLSTLGQRASAAILFAFATLFRANGILLAGFLVWDMLWCKRINLSLLRKVVEAFTLVSVSVSPFVGSQVWAYMRFCSPQATRLWCSNGTRSVYSFVQSHYWDVGLLRYWTLSQLPNFLLAFPVLLVLGYSIYTLSPPRVWMHLVPSSNPPAIVPHLVLSSVLLTTLLLISHVQIALRFATPGGLPFFWWGCALLSRKSPWVTTYLILWYFASTILYAGFYPPA